MTEGVRTSLASVTSVPRTPRSTVVGIALASALVPLNSTMVAVALPKVARAFDIGRGRAGLLITVYLVVMLVGQPIAGRVSDVLGNKRVALTSLLGFAAGSIGAALSPSFAWLVGWRGMQALFAAALAPSVQSMLRSVTRPSERGHAFGILGSVIGVGAASGPIVGGLLVGSFGWKAIFVANVPAAAIALVVLASVKVNDLAAEIAAVPRNGEGESSPVKALPVGRNELLRPSFVAAFATQALANFGQYALLLIAPIVLDRRGWGSRETGLALSALTVGLIVMGPPGGRFGDRSGSKRAILRGLSVGAFGAALLLPFGIAVAPAMLIVALAVFGMGQGFASSSIIAAGLEAVPPHQTGVAAGILSASRYVGSISASLLLAACVADDGSGGRIMYVATGVALVLAVGASRRLPDRAVADRPSIAVAAGAR